MLLRKTLTSHLPMKKAILLYIAISIPVSYANTHDVEFDISLESRKTLFLNHQEITAINKSILATPLLNKAFKDKRHHLQYALQHNFSIDLFSPENVEAETQHAALGKRLYDAALLYKITQESIYSEYIQKILNLYADFYVSTKSSNKNSDRLFTKIEHEAEWLIQALFALDSIHDQLSDDEIVRLDNNLFTPMTLIIETAFANNITDTPIVSAWAVSAIGIKGLFFNNKKLLKKALQGPRLNQHRGYYQLLDTFISPDGYYRDGPSLAIDFLYPLLRFAEIFNRYNPDSALLSYKDNILKKSYYAIIKTMYPDGSFPTFNTTIDRSIYDERVIYANSAIYHHYGSDSDLLAITNLQNHVALCFNALTLVSDFHQLDTAPTLSWPSVEFNDSTQENKGGIGILRIDDTMLTMKYGLHGGELGHFDQLSVTLFNQDQAVLVDNELSTQQSQRHTYDKPFAIDTTQSYTAQTIAHNTVAVDKTSQNGGSKFIADSVSSRKHFFDTSDKNIKVISAKANEHFPGVEMQRTTFLIKDDRLTRPALVDIFRLSSVAPHKYDYPVHFKGQLLDTSNVLDAHQQIQIPLGEQYGYQHIWEQARGISHQDVQLTWLNQKTPYTLTMAATPNTHFIIGRTGANDPKFTLDSKPVAIFRNEASDHLFATVLETHRTLPDNIIVASKPSITSIKVLGFNAAGTAIEVKGRQNLHWRIFINNMDATNRDKRLILNNQEFKWKGNYHVDIIKTDDELISQAAP